MSFNKYYQDELSYLRDLGSLFSQQNPGLSRFLSEDGQDPDVERLFEGFAFLTGRLRQKLDDELPEITHALIGLLWPHYLRPLPSMSILEFKPIANALSEGRTIERGAEVQSVEVEGSSCVFRTCYNVDVYPIEIDDVDMENHSDGALLSIKFNVDEGAATDSWGLEKLQLFLHGDRDIHISQALYLWLFRYLDHIEVRATSDQTKSTRLPASALEPVGFAEDEELIPYGNRSFRGYRYLQEYFALPEKFLFVRLQQLKDILCVDNLQNFELVFRFNRRFDSQMRIKKNHIRLNCSPIINLFNADCDPIGIDAERLEYPIRPSHKEQQHIELYEIKQVFGKRRGRSEPQEYPPYESFNFELKSSDKREDTVFYKLRRCHSTLLSGLDTYISFVGPGGEQGQPKSENISIELLCSNRRLPETLRPGDIIYPSSNSPEFVTFKNISRITSSLPPPMQEGLHWQLISQMALHYRAMSKADSLRTLMKSYNFRAYYDRQAERSNQMMMEAIQSVETSTTDRLVRGAPVRCLTTTLKLQESKFGAKGLQGESAMFLFASVLNGFFSQYANINSFHQMIVEGVENGETYQWQTAQGQKYLI